MSIPIRIELPTFFGMKTVNCFLFRDPVPTLIDCGENTPAVWQALQKGLEEHGLRLEDIERVFITHAHVDHMGSAARIAEASGATIWLSPLVYPWGIDIDTCWSHRSDMIAMTLKKMMGPKSYAAIQPIFQQMEEMIKTAWPNIPAHQIKQFELNGSIELGGANWNSFHAPGHCNNQTCFFNPQNGAMLSADMLLKITPTPVIDAQIEDPTKREKGIFKLLNSYQQLQKMDIHKVFPGHYDVFDQPNELINYQVERIHMRKNNCFDIIKSGLSDFMEIGKQMYGNNLHLPSISMIVGYLDLLESEQRIRFEETNDKLIILPQ